LESEAQPLLSSITITPEANVLSLTYTTPVEKPYVDNNIDNIRAVIRAFFAVTDLQMLSGY
jgi:hypothetical protein